MLVRRPPPLLPHPPAWLPRIYQTRLRGDSIPATSAAVGRPAADALLVAASPPRALRSIRSTQLFDFQATSHGSPSRCTHMHGSNLLSADRLASESHPPVPLISSYWSPVRIFFSIMDLGKVVPHYSTACFTIY
ncbi:unnamed protein product [Urochloa humidicola]